MRSLAAIDADIRKVCDRLAALRGERRAVVEAGRRAPQAARDAAIVAAFDGGETNVRLLAERHGMKPTAVYQVLWKNERSIIRARHAARAQRLAALVQRHGAGQAVM